MKTVTIVMITRMAKKVHCTMVVVDSVVVVADGVDVVVDGVIVVDPLEVVGKVAEDTEEEEEDTEADTTTITIIISTITTATTITTTMDIKAKDMKETVETVVERDILQETVRAGRWTERMTMKMAAARNKSSITHTSQQIKPSLQHRATTTRGCWMVAVLATTLATKNCSAT